MSTFTFIYLFGIILNILFYVKRDPAEIREKAFIDKYGEYGRRWLKDLEPYETKNKTLKWIYRIVYILGSFFSWIFLFIFYIYLGVKHNWFKDNPYLYK